MVRKAESTINTRLEEFTNKEIKKHDSLIGQKLISNGPAGSGKTYHIKDNIINVLTEDKKIGLYNPIFLDYTILW